MKLLRTVGATSQIFQIFIADSSSTTGAGLAGLTNASSGLTAYYHRDADTTATAISLVTMTVGTFTSSGFKEIDATNMPGWYQFCPPNAALASGAKSVGMHLKGAANMAPLPIEIDLDAQVDVTFWNGTVVATPATAGIPDVNAKNINNVATTSITTINANLGTTQPLGFTGAGASALVKSDMVDIAGAAVSATTAQIGVNVVNIAGTASQGAAGYVGTDQSKITNPTATVDLSGTTIKNLDNTPPGSPGTAAQVAAAVWQDATAGDFIVSGSIGKSLFTGGNAPGAANGLVIAGSNASITTTNLVLGAMSIGGNPNVAQSGDTFGSLPAHFSALIISAGGRVSILQNAQKNTALAGYEFQMASTTAPYGPAIGLTVAGEVSKDGGAFGALTNAVSEVGGGTYKIDLAAADLNANVSNLQFTAAGAFQVNNVIITTP